MCIRYLAVMPPVKAEESLSNANSSNNHDSSLPSSRPQYPSTEYRSVRNHGSKAEAEAGLQESLGKTCRTEDDIASKKTRDDQRLQEREREFKVKHLGILGVLLWIL